MIWRLTRLYRRLRCRIVGHEWTGVYFAFAGWDECMCCGKQGGQYPGRTFDEAMRLSTHSSTTEEADRA